VIIRGIALRVATMATLGAALSGCGAILNFTGSPADPRLEDGPTNWGRVYGGIQNSAGFAEGPFEVPPMQVVGTLMFVVDFLPSLALDTATLPLTAVFEATGLSKHGRPTSAPPPPERGPVTRARP
jgi:hypothetical protein